MSSIRLLQALCPALFFAKITLLGSYETTFREGVTVALVVCTIYCEHAPNSSPCRLIQIKVVMKLH